MAMLSERARPKINLFLHILGKRPDGYHTLESLAVFADMGDTVAVEPGAALSLHITGPFGEALDAGGDNLVLSAARALQDWARGAGQTVPGAALHLEKHLPIASGIGGGSADAAAALRVLCRLWKLDICGDALADIAIALGADVPVCLDSRSRMMGGIGEVLLDAPALPPGWIVLANPMRSVSTAAVFSALELGAASGPFSPPETFDTVEALTDWLKAETRNDLEAPARRIAPEIDEVLTALDACKGAQIARMSGSGATCFALFDQRVQAMAAQDKLRARFPKWWVKAAALSR